MTSGTVTKKPAMKLRRSHCIIGRRTRSSRRAGSDAEPTTAAERETVVGEHVERVPGEVAQEELDRRGSRRRADDTMPTANSQRRGASRPVSRMWTPSLRRRRADRRHRRAGTKTAPPIRASCPSSIAGRDRRARARHAGHQRRGLRRRRSSSASPASASSSSRAAATRAAPPAASRRRRSPA